MIKHLRVTYLELSVRGKGLMIVRESDETRPLDGDVEAAYGHMELRMWLRWAVSQAGLSDREQTVILLRYNTGDECYAQIGARMGLSEKQVDNAMMCAIKKLRKWAQVSEPET